MMDGNLVRYQHYTILYVCHIAFRYLSYVMLKNIFYRFQYNMALPHRLLYLRLVYTEYIWCCFCIYKTFQTGLVCVKSCTSRMFLLRCVQKYVIVCKPLSRHIFLGMFFLLQISFYLSVCLDWIYKYMIFVYI